MNQQSLLGRGLTTLAKAYVRRELPKWGVVCETASRLPNSGVVDATNKLFGYTTSYDLSQIGDRQIYLLGRWQDLPPQLVLSCLPEGTIIDIGANRGDFALPAAALCKRVLCFEPNPEMVALIERDIQRNNITNLEIHACGLSDQPGTLTLHVPAGGPSCASFGSIKDAKRLPDIPILVGDDVLASETPTLIKIDVEGFELHVLRGLAATITRTRPYIITEVVSEWLERCGSSVHELQIFMRNLGYQRYGLGTRGVGSDHVLTLDDSRSDNVLWVPGDGDLSPFEGASLQTLRAWRKRRSQG